MDYNIFFHKSNFHIFIFLILLMMTLHVLFRFLEEYGKYNLSFWGLTSGNEPTAGQMTNYSFQALGFTPETQRDWIALDLGPALHSSSFPKTCLMILDDNRVLLPHWAKVVSEDGWTKRGMGRYSLRCRWW